MTDSKKTTTDQDVSPKGTPPNTVRGNISGKTAQQAWVQRFWPLLLAATISLVWSGVCLWWFMDSGKTIARMPLYEAGGLMAGASLPLIFIWLIALVYLRTDPLRDHRTALAHGLDGLLAPLDLAQKRVNHMVAELHKEIKHVEVAGDVATTRIDNLKIVFRSRSVICLKSPPRPKPKRLTSRNYYPLKEKPLPIK